MRRRTRGTDVVIVGGGPAGSAAAIAAARAGARVILLERHATPRDRPGETLHPGIEPLLRWLGADDLLAEATVARHEGHWVRGAGRRRFLRFGRDASGPWLGFQAWRRTFDAGLRRRAADLGVEVRTGTAVAGILRDGGRVLGVATEGGEELPAAVTIDAAGGGHWIARQLGLGVTRLSPRLIATFGYTAPAPAAPARRLPREPELSADAGGWTWIAPLGAKGWHWSRLALDGRRAERGWQPARLAGLTPVGPSRGADVTWRMVPAAGGPGWLAAGDAGAVLDPASSHGVLRALLSGAQAGVLAATAGSTDARERFGAYDAWFRQGVTRDAETLRASYATLFPGRAAPARLTARRRTRHPA
ncbi:MAG: NAD(P)/FAD-dependent oxidoreductase [Gemmatimonadales bacterium]